VRDERHASGDEWLTVCTAADHNPRTMPAPLPASRRARQGGFTLIELMIAVAVIALLLGIALPSFMDSMRKSRRSEAFTAVASVQQAQERYRSRASNYSTSFSELGVELGESDATRPNGYYRMSLAAATSLATGYVVTAQAAGSQTADTKCAFMEAKVERGNVTYGSGTSSSIVYPDPNRCWAK
jgi:type IV pilus assembly protein PilE